MPEDYVIKVDHLTKVYKIFDNPVDRVKEAFHPFNKRYSHDFYALKDLSFTVKKGENIGFVGRNGAGKSTLLKLITGILTPTAGGVDVRGTVASLLELGAGFNPEMTGRENIFLNGSIMGQSHEQMQGLLPDIVDFADIGEFIEQPVKMYSSGMFARLAFAVNAFVEPDILIVDEALSVGDNLFQMKCMKKMRELMEGGTAVLFVSHDMNAVRRFCGKAIWIDHGEVRQEGDTNEVLDSYAEYLKYGEQVINPPKVEAPEEAVQGEQEERQVLPGVLAEITSVKFIDSQGEEQVSTAFDEPVSVEVEYEVFQEQVERPVLGIALKSIDDTYICGLNTLLDHKRIPWKKGLNRMQLSYQYGLRVLGGRYYIDVALYEETATVPIQYLGMAKEIRITADYPGEGEFVLPHRWES